MHKKPLFRRTSVMPNLEMKFYSKNSPKKGYSWETEPAAIPEAQIAETLTADVIIIGGGISGLAAAARVTGKGLSAIIIDKNKRTVALAGQIAAVNTKTMAEKGVVIDKKQLAADWLKVSGSRVEESLLWLFINRSGEGFEWLLDLAEGEVEASVYNAYKGPWFTEYPGTHHIFKKPDSTKYKEFGGGTLACEILEKETLKNGGQIFRSTVAEYIEKDADGRVTSAIAKGADELYRRYIGTKAVVIATGDASHNKEMLEAFCPTGLRAAKSFPRAGNTGDGQKMAYWAGAALDNPEWAPTLHALGYSGYQFFFLHVNRLGKRFMNEDTWMQAKSIRCLMQPGGDFAFSIFDAKWLDEVGERWDLLGGQGMAPLSTIGDKFDRETLKKAIDATTGVSEPGEFDPFVNPGNGFFANTLEELAEKIEVPFETLKATIDRYNEIVASGDDTDFGKRKEMLTPITQAPYYALKWGPSLLDVFGGALINEELNVLGADANPIPGLYAIGNAAGGMYAIDYPLLLNGNSYGRALAYACALGDALA
jgi:succinate dehydrogenase/fumarate reductase flavoprotein subunit